MFPFNIIKNGKIYTDIKCICNVITNLFLFEKNKSATSNYVVHQKFSSIKMYYLTF